MPDSDETQTPKRAVAFSIQVEVFEPPQEDYLDNFRYHGGTGQIIEHWTREARSLVVPLASLSDDVTAELSALIAAVQVQLEARYRPGETWDA